MEYTIKCHTPGYEHKKPHIFALSKGYNAGKPLRNECPNCFVLIFKDTENAEKMFFLLDGVWRSQIFRQQLIGSVIPFIRVGEFTKTINRYWMHIHENPDRAQRLIEAFKAMQTVQQNCEDMYKLINVYKQITYREILKMETKAEFRELEPE